MPLAWSRKNNKSARGGAAAHAPPPPPPPPALPAATSCGRRRRLLLGYCRGTRRLDGRGAAGGQVEVVCGGRVVGSRGEEEGRIVLHRRQLRLQVGLVDVVCVVRAPHRTLYLLCLLEQVGHVVLQVLDLVDVDRLELLLERLVGVLHRRHRARRLLQALLRNARPQGATGDQEAPPSSCAQPKYPRRAQSASLLRHELRGNTAPRSAAQSRGLGGHGAWLVAHTHTLEADCARWGAACHSAPPPPARAATAPAQT
mmetsp:Transcript_56856/g.151324  ORF Transcript_56856/g.151324 Transcript_56856/m.151324 type:complete len:256 (-) Transcript_56856:319-1086(-)